MISALEGRGVDALLNEIAAQLPPTRRKAELLIPFSSGGVAAMIRRDGAVYEEEYTENGLRMVVTVDIDVLEKYKDWVLQIF